MSKISITNGNDSTYRVTIIVEEVHRYSNMEETGRTSLVGVHRVSEHADITTAVKVAQTLENAGEWAVELSTR